MNVPLGATLAPLGESSMKASLLFAALAVSISAGAPVRADQPRAVIELFTSQGCSSCPPADQLLTELAKERDLVVLSLPVDYWDYLGWKDTLASPTYSSRQRAYAQRRGDGQVYTPQVVIDGLIHALGSSRTDIEAAARAVRGREGALSVPVALTDTGNSIAVNVGAAVGEAKSGSVWLCPVIKAQPVAIGRGENRGRSVTYANVVRGMVKIGEWRGEPLKLDVPAATAKQEGADGYVVLLQGASGGHPGAILGAAKGAGL
jgi:hypothetical protein